MLETIGNYTAQLYGIEEVGVGAIIVTVIAVFLVVVLVFGWLMYLRKLLKQKKQVSELKPIKANKKIMTESNFYTGLKKWFMDKYKPADMYLIEMTHSNGTLSHYTLPTEKHKFTVNGMTYIIDEDRKVFNNTTRLYMLRFHEGFALPYQVEISSHEMKGNLPEHPLINEVKTSFNPFILPDVLKFEYAKGVIQGAEISNYIKRGFLIQISTLIVCILHLIVDAVKNGWIQ